MASDALTPLLPQLATTAGTGVVSSGGNHHWYSVLCGPKQRGKCSGTGCYWHSGLALQPCCVCAHSDTGVVGIKANSTVVVPVGMHKSKSNATTY